MTTCGTRKNRYRGGDLTTMTATVNVPKKTLKNKLKNLGSRATAKLANVRNTIGAKAINLGYRLQNTYDRTFQRGGEYNMRGMMNMATMKARNLGSRALQKAKNVGQTLKNKYNMAKTKYTLNDEFMNRPNTAGMKPGRASRNLLKVANNQKMRRMMRNRNRGMTSGNAYQGASMATSLFF